MKFYILQNREPVEVDIATWADWFEDTKNSRVAFTHITNERHESIEVSTVFIGLNLSPHTKPMLYETSVTGGLHDGHVQWYRTWEEAEAGHAALAKTSTLLVPKEESREN